MGKQEAALFSGAVATEAMQDPGVRQGTRPSAVTPGGRGWADVTAFALGVVFCAALAGPLLAGERPPAPKRNPAQVRQELREPRLDAKALADRIDRREPAQGGKGVMRFGDTEIRVGGRASFGYGYSGR